MKIKVDTITGTTKNRVLNQTELVRFQLINPILKTHFKTLMGLSTLYDRATKTGHIKKQVESDFYALVEKIEASNADRCKKSHEQAIAKKKEKPQELTFEDYCEEFLDQQVCLMSDHEKEAAMSSFLSPSKPIKSVNPVAPTSNIEPVRPEKDVTDAVFAYLVDSGFSIEKGNNERYFLVQGSQTQGELIGVLGGGQITVNFDKGIYGTTLPIPDRVMIHAKLAEIYNSDELEFKP